MKALLFFLTIMSFVATDLLAQTTSNIILSGQDNVPRVQTPALGNVDVTVHGDSLFVSGSFENLRSSYWSAFIQFGEPGESGNRIYRLTVDINEEKNGGEFDEEKNRFEMRPAIREALKNGNLYVQISTSRHQNGEIRGQIPRM